MMLGTNLDQTRSSFVWNLLSKEDFTREYVSLAKGAPALIMNNGLMQALVYYQNRSDAESRKLVGHVAQWLAERNLVEEPSFEGAMRDLAGCGSRSYMAATQEALEIVAWIKRIADAVHRGRKGERDAGSGS